MDPDPPRAAPKGRVGKVQSASDVCPRWQSPAAAQTGSGQQSRKQLVSVETDKGPGQRLKQGPQISIAAWKWPRCGSDSPAVGAGQPEAAAAGPHAG